ncbi:MAG TPA: DUF3048 domain-containing protein [Pseudogracilibacillus sp.]|nr:DUF3048 domain-containing protein [Pseudogracilibacillus sp.]
MRKSLLVLVLVLITALAVACSKDGESLIKPADTIYTYPFTGLETNEEPTNRAVAVMVNNQTQARPQSGLHEADIVFELLAEGNITRFLALYQSTLPERVGPVRSAREYYVNLAEGYDALYIYHGAAKFVDKMIAERGIEHLNGAKSDNDGELFVRESFRVAPHNSYVLFDEVYNRAKAKDYDAEFVHDSLSFLEDGETVSGTDASGVKIEYYQNSLVVEYEYDEARQKYIRISDGEQTKDLESETPIEVDNVFIIEADHNEIDSEGRRAIDLESGGFGYLLQEGKYKQVEWKNDKGYIVPIKDNEVIPFVKGKTWINVVQTTPSTNVEQVQIWENNE